MIEVQATKSTLSAHGGICVINQLIKSFDFRSRIGPSVKCLDAKGDIKFIDMMLGLTADAQCLDDMAVLSDDSAFSTVAPGSYTPKSYGDFLRKFSEFDIKQLNYQLIQTSLELRSKTTKAIDQDFILDIDSTTNEQHGKKMEGCAFDYAGTFGLSTVHAHDQFGMPYWHWVREGNTFSAKGSGEVIHAVFSRLPAQKPGQRKYFSRADSAYCNTEYFNACATKRVGAVVAMRNNIFGDDHVGAVSDRGSEISLHENSLPSLVAQQLASI